MAALYDAMLMEQHLGDPVIWHAVSLVICASVLAHGMTGAPFTRWYGRSFGCEDVAGTKRAAGNENRR